MVARGSPGASAGRRPRSLQSSSCLWPGSHRAMVPAPLSFRQGRELGWLQQRAVHVSPQLRAGDLLLVCGTAVHGLRPGTTPGKQLLLSQTFITASLAPRGLPSPTPQPALPWTEALSERQRSRMGLLPQPPSEAAEPNFAVMVLDPDGWRAIKTFGV